MIDRKAFAKIVTNGGTEVYDSLAQAFEVSNLLREAHSVWARSVKGVYVEVKSWAPDECSEPQGDTFGGMVNNQWVVE